MTTTPRRPQPAQLVLDVAADVCCLCGADIRVASWWENGRAYCCNECPFCSCGVQAPVPPHYLRNGNGMLRCANARIVTGLIVKGGVVVDAPPIARRWAMGRPAATCAREAKARGATVTWHPDPAYPDVVPD